MIYEQPDRLVHLNTRFERLGSVYFGPSTRVYTLHDNRRDTRESQEIEIK